MRHIVCMIAGDERDAGPIGVAKMLARRTDATVALLHARVPGADPPVFDEPGVSVLLDDGPAADVAARALERLSADLLVMGRSEDGTPGHGEHGRSILRAAGCPVLVIPERAPLTFASAVVGMDLSPGALEALAWAHALVSPAAAPRITCVAIVSPEGAKPEALGRSFRAAIAERGLAEPELELVPGASPADALVERSARCDLVCVGSRGLSPLASAVLGSTAERVAARAACPVLVVRHRGDARGLFGALFG